MDFTSFQGKHRRENINTVATKPHDITYSSAYVRLFLRGNFAELLHTDILEILNENFMHSRTFSTRVFHVSLSF